MHHGKNLLTKYSCLLKNLSTSSLLLMGMAVFALILANLRNAMIPISDMLVLE